MRIINVIEVENHVVKNVLSFPVWDEDKVNSVSDEAEQMFINQVIANCEPADDNYLDMYLDSHVEDGYYYNNNYSVSIVWSNVI